ncbi:alkyl sulfatase dimerization domain-containing protein [Flammeovirga sp. EKP202]|uniref:alkyl sulfatase dimerization domain-containing protein n=1 Tax=Flammeovirga sp. EKP202 TaxID=2770592 RepID=UPI00165FE6FC|nr:alkyl sulfatase dimerization domain-containing protein [Flammeovirga sp. EKP202]MBD0399951.1 MBL fold metallo-hydrolase [Flammeovirga sp. EKP202]
MNTKIILSITAFVIMMSNTLNAQNKSPYTGGNTELVTMPHGAVVNKNLPERLSKVVHESPQVVELGKGVWSLEGFSIANLGVIEGETGLIVYDTGNDNENAREFLKGIRTVTDKPVKTIIYSHSHYVSGGKGLLEGNEEYTVIGHPKVNKNILESGGKGASIPELAPVLEARYYEQFNVYVPSEGADAPFNLSPVPSKDKEFLPVTKTVENEELLEIDGVKIQFFTDYDSDTDDCLMIYLPEKEVVFSNIYWNVYPNLYTLRGSLYRDPTPWMKGLQKIRDLGPKYMFGTHSKAVIGKNEVREAVTYYHDGLAYIYDQTLRRIILGESPDELRHTVTLPEHLAKFSNNQFSYGEESYYAPNIYNYALGWFNGNTMDLNPSHPLHAAQKIVEGFGGKENVIKAILKASEEKDFAWSTQLAGYLYKVFPNDQEVRQITADQLRSMGQLAEAIIPRSWYLGQANALENKTEILHIVLPKPEHILQSEPGTYVNMMRVRIDPEKSINTDQFLVFQFTDIEEQPQFGLHIRNGVAEYVENPSAYYKSQDVLVKVPRALFAAYYAGTIDIEKLLSNPQTSSSIDKSSTLKLLNQFDWFNVDSPVLKLNKV